MENEEQDGGCLIGDEQVSVEYLQARVERLQELVCLLLIKNQTIRMALTAGKAEGFRDGCGWTAAATMRPNWTQAEERTEA